MLSLSINTVTLLYLIASVCFIQALKGLSHPTTSIRGNLFGMTGMAIAMATTVGLISTMAQGISQSASVAASAAATTSSIPALYSGLGLVAGGSATCRHASPLFCRPRGRQQRLQRHPGRP